MQQRCLSPARASSEPPTSLETFAGVGAAAILLAAGLAATDWVPRFVERAAYAEYLMHALAWASAPLGLMVPLLLTRRGEAFEVMAVRGAPLSHFLYWIPPALLLSLLASQAAFSVDTAFWTGAIVLQTFAWYCGRSLILLIVMSLAFEAIHAPSWLARNVGT